MNMFPNYQASIPKNRAQMVSELEIPEVTLSPYIWTETDVSLSTDNDSVLTGSADGYERGTLSTDSSLPLSRAMTDSDIDYGRYRRYKSRSFSDPWMHMRTAMEAFPPDYLASLRSYQCSSTGETKESGPPAPERWLRYNEELKLKMERFFDEECRVFTSDDPGLADLEEALLSLELKTIDSDLDSSSRS